ncbi:Phosphate-repressible phosphate permease pho-4 [Fulvia fulva]|nr:Phosphate-repressible phosphate permease pho-4 [Fulvia fulva]KAK4614349.1 Phosphate-repressible phosphate permease pho-4 [Fulvia fulva]WPV20398.1 Phosphate-repressible phosphate permease pho-4 [Fulvia fulva]WPV35313.1 Phosphate-repressible phosphate permease pho-4 [Fulvia fulva]
MLLSLLTKRQSPATARYDWILAITFIAYCFSAFGNGANDVANAYATSVAARTLSMVQVGFLSIITEFFGAVVLGERVTDTIKNGIITIDRFEGRPGVLMLAMGCAEVGSASWLMFATSQGMPVSTTQTVVGALIGVGFATQAPIQWAWDSGSVSQVAASWGIAPVIAGAFAALVFGLVKYTVLERKDSFKWAMRLIPWYFGLTAAILALFIAIEAPGSDIDTLGGGTIAGIIFAVFFGITIICYIFFMPFFERKLIRKDTRLRVWHIPMGPLLRNDNVKLYFPGKGDEYVTNYYEDAYGNVSAGKKDEAKAKSVSNNSSDRDLDPDAIHGTVDVEKRDDKAALQAAEEEQAMKRAKSGYVPPYERWIVPVQGLWWSNPKKLWNWTKFIVLRGVSIDAVSHDSETLREIHAHAHRYDVRVEHLWTYCQVISAMLMSIAHGSNDIANAVGPVAAVYQTYRVGEVATESSTPVWILVLGGLLLGLGFWFMGYHIVRALGNKITQMSPTRGFSIELGAAITVLMASRLGLPVSTTQCLTGAAVGVALMNYDLKAVNWRQVVFIFMGWVLTLPCAGLISGLLCLMALNAPSF